MENPKHVMYFAILNTIALEQKHQNFEDNTFKTTFLDENWLTFVDENWFEFHRSFS